MIPVKSRTVLVTGASRGIGRAIALRFAKEGFNVIITCLKNEKELLFVKNEIEQYKVKCHPFIGDIGDYSSVERLFLEIKERFGTIDILINNAGISYIGLLTDMTIEDWNRVLQTNLSSAFYCCKLAIPDMVKQQKGKIINISSVWGSIGASCEVAYSASKGGLNAFTKALAKELAPSNIQVNAIACGVIETEMNGFLEEEERQALVEEIPSNRFGTPDEVANFVYDLATGHEYLTGQVIHLDGAWL